MPLRLRGEMTKAEYKKAMSSAIDTDVIQKFRSTLEAVNNEKNNISCKACILN